jgi:hypothetical protein
MGGVSYDIVAVDRTKEAIDSATQGVDSVGVHYSDTISNIAFNFNMLTMAAETAYSFMMKGWNETIGVAEQYQDQMDNMHNMFGMTIEDAQKWRATSIATDTDINSLSVTMRYLTQRVTDQSEAGEKLRATLKGIGVDVKDSNGNWKDGSDLMMDVIQALHDVPEGAERAGVAYDILGRNWYRVADMINNADTAVKTFEETSPGITEEDSEKIERFKVKWALLAEKIELAKVNIGLWAIEYAEANKTMGSGQALGEDPYSAFMLETFGFNKKVSGAGGRSGNYDPGVRAGADYTGKTIQADMLSTSTENLFLNLTDTDREIKYQTEVVIPGYEEALKKAEAAGTGVMEAQYNLANAYDHLSDLKSQDTDQTKAQVQSYKEYQQAIEKVNDLQKDQIKNEALLAYDVGIAMSKGDVVAARSAIMSFNRNQIDASMDIAEAQTSVSTEASEFNQIRSGVPLEQVKGTSQYEKAQALVAGDLILQVGQLSKDYPLSSAVEDGAKLLRQSRISMGGRVQGS